MSKTPGLLSVDCPHGSCRVLPRHIWRMRCLGVCVWKGISPASQVFAECISLLLSVVHHAVQAKRMHISMCIKATRSRDPEASPSLELLDRIMDIRTDQGLDSHSMRAIRQALPGRSLGS